MTSAPLTQTFHYGARMFNIDKARSLLQQHLRNPEPTLVTDWAAHYHLHHLTPDYDGTSWCPIFGPDQSHFNAAHAMQTDLDKPVIIATMEFDGRAAVLLIDGLHRMYRAMVEARVTLPAHTLTVAETASIRES
ncbi:MULTISPECIES: hypothetical protein [unclassified Streptomyces]|uniref:hypothetical protein n=1 Tax=unclassified Streptomyces TaxID=2593676 RepID=UPI00093E25B1|nr:hypothetical protein [Streptomyces sp. CB01883]OKJ80698.1 hypothetical protein AMK32_23235 [Streptomyces sp. CB01883]